MIDFMNQNANDDTYNYNQIHSKFKHKSSWSPPLVNKTLETFKRACKQSLLHTKINSKNTPNLTKEEFEGLDTLRKNPHIVIKKTDKGSAVVVMNTTDYLREGYRQLSDPNFYVKKATDTTSEISDKICEVLTRMKTKNLITEKNFDYLHIKNPKAGRFYLLPKIHKKQAPGRPICSSVGHPTSHISSFVDEHIKGYVPKTKSYVRDTQHFIKRLHDIGQIPEHSLLHQMSIHSIPIYPTMKEY